MQITSAEHAAAFEDADLGEAFELFIQQHQYFEVLNLSSGIYATLSTFEVGGCYNASHWFRHDGKQYEFEHMNDRGEIVETFYKFETMAEAIAFAADLLKVVKEGV